MKDETEKTKDVLEDLKEELEEIGNWRDRTRQENESRRRYIEHLTCECCDNTADAVYRFVGGVHARLCPICASSADEILHATSAWLSMVTLDAKAILMTGTNNVAEKAADLAGERVAIHAEIAQLARDWLSEHRKR